MALLCGIYVRSGGLLKILNFLRTKDNEKEPKWVVHGPTRESNSDNLYKETINEVNSFLASMLFALKLCSILNEGKKDMTGRAFDTYGGHERGIQGLGWET
jgi:hypothetical protein